MTSLKKARGMRDIGNQGNGVNVPLEVFDLMAQAYEEYIKELEEELRKEKACKSGIAGG